jgi:hypothetical protein
MSTPDDGGDSPQRALLVALLAMAGVALLVGLAIAGAAVVVLNGAGVGDTEAAAARRGDATLYIPRYQPTKSVESDLGLPTPDTSESPSAEPSESATPRTDQIKLFAAPQSVGPGERINFNGVYVDGEGVALQIQRKEGGTWVDFPVTATVRGGVFSTWIQTTHTGESPFRVYDAQADRASNVVVITVG